MTAFDANYNRRSGHAQAKTATQQCHICRCRIRLGEWMILVGEGRNPKRYHRNCLRFVLNFSYDLEPANGMEIIEADVGVDPTGKKHIEAYRAKILEKMGIEE